jgi:hypothetical protein
MEAGSAMQRLCGAPRRQGGAPCRRPAGAGTDHLGRGVCSYHGGLLPALRQKYAREQALEESVNFGGAVDVDPITLLLGMVHRCAAVAGWLRLKVEALDAGELVDPDGRPCVWVRLESEWVDRSTRTAKAALDAGVAERQIRIAERTGARIAGALEEAVEPLDLSAEARTQLVARFVTALTRLEQTEDV